MKKLLITLVAVAAVSFSSYGFSRYYFCDFAQQSRSVNVYNVQKNFTSVIFAKRETTSSNPYVRYTAYNENGGTIEYSYVGPTGTDKSKVLTLTYRPSLEGLYKFNFYFRMFKQGDVGAVYIWW